MKSGNPARNCTWRSNLIAKIRLDLCFSGQQWKHHYLELQRNSTRLGTKIAPHATKISEIGTRLLVQGRHFCIHSNVRKYIHGIKHSNKAVKKNHNVQSAILLSRWLHEQQDGGLIQEMSSGSGRQICKSERCQSRRTNRDRRRIMI